MTVQERIDEKAKELYAIYWDSGEEYTLSWDKLSLQNVSRWKKLSKSVLISELRARVEENKSWHYANNPNAEERINELTKQIEELENYGK